MLKILNYKLFILSAKSDVHRIAGDCIKELINCFEESINPFQILLENILKMKKMIEKAFDNQNTKLSEIESRRESIGHLFDAINIGGLNLLEDITRKNESFSGTDLSDEEESHEFLFDEDLKSSGKDVQSYFFNSKSHFASKDYSEKLNSGMSLKENKSRFL